MDINEKNTVLITCGPGLTPYLEKEVEGLGFEVRSSHKTGLETLASLYDCMRLNLCLRTAYSVMYLLEEFECDMPDELYRHVASVKWADIISPDEYVSVDSNIDTPSVNNSMYANLKVKDAIVDTVLKKAGTRPDSGSLKENLVFNLYWKDRRCWLYLNTSGQKLSDRGYRKIPHKAPMKETLAAAVIMETGYDGSVPFISPMCGSGTLAIEAALIAQNRAPGLLRGNFGFMHIKDFDKENWQELRRQVYKTSKKIKPAKIIATDIDERAVEAAKKNATTAGVDQLIDFGVCDFADTNIPQEKGIVVVNPEYGQRMGEISELEKTYERIGDYFKQKCAGFTGYIFTGNLDLAKKVGLKASRRIIFYNGDIECRLLKYELYEGTRKKIKH